MLAATYYVSTLGNDAAAGTGSQPFASIRRAAIAAKPGDTVLVRGGTYAPSQQIWIGTSGTKSNRITYKPFKNEKVFLDGKNMPGGTDLLSIGGDYNTVQGFTIRNSKQIGVVVVEADGIRLTGNRVTGSAWQGIAGTSLSGKPYADLVIENNTVDNNAKGFFNEAIGQFAQGMALQKASKVTIRDNYVYNNWGEGILISQCGDGSTIERNRTHDNFGIEIYLMDQNGAVVRNNFTYSTGDTRFYRYNAPSRSVQIANETWGAPQGSKRNTIVNNVAYKNSFGLYYGNYYVGGGMHDTVVANNTWVDTTDGTIRIDDDAHSNTRINNNIISQSAKKPYVFWLTPQRGGVTFNANLWYGNGTLISAAKSKNDLFVDPKFVKRGTYIAKNYKLQTSSTAINRGTSVSLTIDFNGSKRVLGKAIDIGAFEIR